VGAATINAVDEIQERIRDKIGPQRFKIWFKNSTKLSLDGSYLRVDVPNPFIGGWIENNFSEQIATAARETTGRMLDVTFAIDPQLLMERRREQTDSQAKFIEEARSSTPTRSAGNNTSTGCSRQRLRYRLDAFVVGRPNRLAYNGVISVVDNVISPFNPLFIHGGCGLGKTHLLQGLCNAINERHRGIGCCYVSGEEFTNQFILAVKTSTLDSFRRKYRGVDVLVIDDVHFLANKRATQEEFLHTFNAIDGAGKQLVIASDAHPRMIGQLSDPLVTRFVSGMVVKVDPPDMPMRCAILKQRAAALGHSLPDPVVNLLAEHLTGNVRELEGALLKLIAYSSLCNEPMDLAMGQKVVNEYLRKTRTVIQISDIETVTAAFFGLSPADIHASKRTRTVALARSIAMYLARKHTQMSFPEIGKYMGNKNHSTVILACKKSEKTLKHDDDVVWNEVNGLRSMKLREIINLLEQQLTNPDCR